jgi:hypothetical protein
MSEMEQAIQAMTELTAAVKESRPDPATFDFETVKAKFETQINELVDLRVQEAFAKMPARKGDPIYAVAIDQSLAEMKGNRYYKRLKAFRDDGGYKIARMVSTPLDLQLSYLLLSKAHAMRPGSVVAPSDDLKEAMKALASTVVGSGDELVPTGMADQLWDDFFLASRVAGLLMPVDMPTSPFDSGLGMGDVTWRKGGENVATTASTPSTAKSTLTATVLITEVNWSYLMDELAVVAMMPSIRQRVAISGAEIIDAFVLNADATASATGNINLDDATPPADSYYLSNGQDGIRALWLADNTSQGVNAGGDALADADITSMQANMGKYGVSPDQAVMVTDVSTYLKGFLDLDAAVTLDKFGPMAVVLTGELMKYRGIPLIVSASHPLAEADGKVSETTANNTLGSVSAFNRTMLALGFIRELTLEVDRDIQKQQFILVASLAEAVAAHGTRSSATHTAGIRNILVS